MSALLSDNAFAQDVRGNQLPEVPQLTLEEAIGAAVGDHPTIRRAKADLAAAEAQRKQARSRFGPTLSASANAFLWNEALTASLAPGGGEVPQLPPPQTPYEEIIAGMFANTEPTVIRDQFTWDVSLTITQPLGPLWSIYYGYRAASYGEEAVEEQLTQTQRDQARDAAVAYFRVLQAQAALETAEQSVEQLQAQVDRLDALVRAGAAMRADKLRIEVALAAALQDVFAARAAVQLARSNLAVAIGRNPQEPVGARAVDGTALPEIEDTLDEALENMVASRPELEQLELRVAQADAGVQATKGQYVPQLVALGQYQHSAGQGLSASDTFFAGLSLSWNIWEWGASMYAVDEAQAQRLSLKETLVQTRRQLGLQVESAWYDLQSAIEAYGVAEAAVEQAREAYRVERVRYEAGKATPTDLLDAQSALTEAVNNRNAALFQALVQHTELTYATGEPMTADRLLGETR